MSRILLNIDIGERGFDDPVDHALMRYADIVNIACGGHAGNADSVRAFKTLAVKKGIMVTAHLSYPDRANFGRTTVNIPIGQLRDSLNAQLALMGNIRAVKFHGALYNDCCSDAKLAAQMGEWLANRGISHVITLMGSELNRECDRLGIEVLSEAFAERRYAYSQATRQLSLVSRREPNACIADLGEALENVRTIVERKQVKAFMAGSAIEDPEVRMVDLEPNTICIHSDSPIALELSKGVSGLLRRENGTSKAE